MIDKLLRFSLLPMGALGSTVPFAGNTDPLGVMKTFSGAYKCLENVRVGTVVIYNPFSHTALVSVQGTFGMIPCVFSDERLSFSFGYSETNPVREGELVLVYGVGFPLVRSGVVIGRIGYDINFTSTGDKYKDPDGYHRRLYTQDEANKATWDRNIPSFMQPLYNKNDNSTRIRTNYRPTDVYPGEFANVNQYNCGIKGGMFSTTLLGGGASLRLSALTNSARLSCESYTRNTMYGSVSEFHNGRYLSSERNFAMLQEERLGGSKPRDKVWTEDSEAPVGGENQTMRPRIKELSGYFGHLVSKFCLRPDPSGGIRVQGKSGIKDSGVSRETIDPSGQYRLSSSGMIAIERTGRIPVPVRKCYPTDKGHDISSNPEKLKPFKHDDSDPAFRQLELFDRQAYDLKNQYSRMEGGEYPDYDVPQEEELEPLKDAYDENFDGNETVKLKKYDLRRAGVFIGEDGSVIIRDAWASEIVMLGGNITISCAGNVIMAPAKTALTIAGDDIVQKAQNSVDIHASEHDVRLSAARNMEIIGGGDEETHPGGVIIESRGAPGASGPWDGKDKGEEARLSGITLKTNNDVVVDGESVNVRSRTNTRIVSGGDDIDGEVSVAARNIKAKSDSTVISSKDGDAHVKVSNGSVAAAAASVSINAMDSVNVSRGRYRPILNWERGDVNIAEEEIPSLDMETSHLGSDDGASGGFSRVNLDNMMFGFRTSEECGTEKNWTIGADGPFTMYEPAWAQVVNIFDTLRGTSVKMYKEDADWGNGRPFPGENAEGYGVYATLPGSPENLARGGINASRKTVKSETQIDKVRLFDSYKIVG